jgi:cytochrome c oxidase cbb3-type subunit III
MKTSDKMGSIKIPYNNNFLDLFISLTLFFGLVGCGQNSDEQVAQTMKPPLQQEVTTSRPPKPVPTLAKVTENTRNTYQWYCAQCHGTKGKGDGINAKLLTVPPRNHTKAEYMETRTDEQLFEAIKFGGLSVGRAPCMPAWEHTLSEDTINSLVQYIRELCQCEAL